MSVGQSSSGFSAVNCRFTRSSCAGGRARFVFGFFFALTDQIPWLLHSFHIRGPLVDRLRSLSSSAIPQAWILPVHVKGRVDAVCVLKVPVADRVLQPFVVRLFTETKHPARHHHRNSVSG